MENTLDPRFDLWERVDTPEGWAYRLVAADARYNHATGFLYRAQPYGVPVSFTVFDVQHALWYGGSCTIGKRRAVFVGQYRSPELAKEAAHILQVAGHFD